MKNFNQNIVHERFKLSECITKIGKVKIKTLIVINKKKKILGTISDGDIRRGILKYKSLKTTASKIMRKKFFFLTKSKIKIY